MSVQVRGPEPNPNASAPADDAGTAKSSPHKVIFSCSRAGVVHGHAMAMGLAHLISTRLRVSALVLFQLKCKTVTAPIGRLTRPPSSFNSTCCSYAALTYFILCYVSLEHDVCNYLTRRQAVWLSLSLSVKI